MSQGGMMEKIGCKKYGGSLEVPVAVQYYDNSNVCRSCLSYSICTAEYEEQEIINKEDNHGKQS
jgi:hypothetical protein